MRVHIMDFTQEQLDQMQSLDELAKAASVQPEMWARLLTVLGGPTSIAELGFITDDDDGQDGGDGHGPRAAVLREPAQRASGRERQAEANAQTDACARA